MKIDEIIENFELLDEWDDRYRYLIELGRALPELPEAARTEANKVRGCASQVWMQTDVKPNGAAGPVLEFVGDSDAHIVRGLIAILLALYSGKPASEILSTDAAALFEKLGLARASHPAALERLSRHGRPHPVRCARRAGGLTLARPQSSASSASQMRSGAFALPLRLRLIAVMTRKLFERELQHHFGRARRPFALALDVFQPLEKTAHVQQQTGEFRTDIVERLRGCGVARRSRVRSCVRRIVRRGCGRQPANASSRSCAASSARG